MHTDYMSTSTALIAIGSILLIAQPSLAEKQGQRTTAAPTQVLIKAKRPGVVISFLRSGEAEPLETGVANRYLWFRIENNTRWPIWLDMSEVPKLYGDTLLYYTIESKGDGKILIDSRCHVCSNNPLDPGHSITFSIPADYARADARIRIAYSFDWEREADGIAGSYSVHSVVFYFLYLPKSALPAETPSNPPLATDR
jgi:hypothetical protein